MDVDTGHFFIFFSGLFLFLLVGAMVFWKLRKKFSSYFSRIRHYKEFERNAHRPFSQVLVQFERESINTEEEVEYYKPICLEPCRDHKAIVLSVLVSLPECAKPYDNKRGEYGLAIGSALVEPDSVPDLIELSPITETEGRTFDFLRLRRS